MLTRLTGRPILTERLWIVIAGITVLVPFVLAKTLREVTLLGFFGTFSTLVVVFCVAIKGGVDYFAPGAVHPATRIVNWTGLANSLAIIAFAYGGSVVYPHVESTMKNPAAWNQVVFYAVLSVTSMYSLIGVTGYLYYGDKVGDIILKSIPPSGASIAVYLLITLHVVVAAPIFLCSFALEQEKILKIDTQYMSATREFTLRALFRTSIVVFLTLIAMFAPYFDVLTGVAGAVANCMTVFVIPVVCHYKLYGWRHRSIGEHIFSFFILVVGFFGLIMGTYSSIYSGIMKNRVVSS